MDRAPQPSRKGSPTSEQGAGSGPGPTQGSPVRPAGHERLDTGTREGELGRRRRGPNEAEETRAQGQQGTALSSPAHPGSSATCPRDDGQREAPGPGPTWKGRKGRNQGPGQTAFNESSAPALPWAVHSSSPPWVALSGGVPGLSERGSGGHHLQGLHSFRVQGCPLDSPPHFWGTETRLSQRGRGGRGGRGGCPPRWVPSPHHPPALPTHHPGRGTGLRPRRNLRAQAGVRSGWGRAQGGRARQATGGFEGGLPYLGKNKIWSSVRLTLWIRCSNALRAASLGGSERAVGHTGLLGTW